MGLHIAWIIKKIIPLSNYFVTMIINNIYLDLPGVPFFRL